ncbi:MULTISPECIES: hypothetical protein [unclassified Streptomyces]|uniref:hypothetical protein n=1 Tax=unclassified Streptomyces TaxID=2593676 RepID=UPI0022B69A68|nr:MULTISPECIES: hypothetical protein [unclassified Streptomyces]MCZ7417769.1 hypothetical protein [Streptomyces sp. WMMC897]MCZ7432435.1 hypothetical protein [Streptomyces sp. WMMC1477]
MFRHVSAPTRFYSQIPNELIRNPRLNGTAVRLLSWALSLPAESRETLTSLAEKMPEGRMAVRKARGQLTEEGYVHTRHLQCAESGRWRTVVLVSNTALRTPEEVDAAFAACTVGHPPTDQDPPVGPPPEQALGEQPLENNGENTHHPPRPEPTPEPDAAPDAAPGAGRDAARDEAPEPSPGPEPDGAAVRALVDVGRAEPRLRLGLAEAARLAPLAREWLARGVSLAEFREAMTAGLPGRVYAPAKLLAHRLREKLPPPVAPPEPSKPSASPPLAECAECCDPLPRGQVSGICRRCAGLIPPPDPGPGLPPGAAKARAAFEAARAASGTRGRGRRYA